MAICQHLSQLEHIDLDLEHANSELQGVRELVVQGGEVAGLRHRVGALRERLVELRGREKQADWEVQDLSARIVKVKDTLYGGKTRNPRELASHEKELDSLQAQLQQKEAAYLQLVGEADAADAAAADESRRLSAAEEAWAVEEGKLRRRESELLAQLADGEQRRAWLVAQIAPEALDVYKSVKGSRQPVVVTVEGGRCKGCRLVLPTQELQRVRTGALVLCSSCGRILCV
ncbi:MAG: C4-type zinc ribbon domain-containing protein [Chloroflexota bacterium]